MNHQRDRSFPPPESEGGWPVLGEAGALRSQGGVDPDRLALAWEYNLDARPPARKAAEEASSSEERVVPRASSSAVVVVRHGHIVGEWYQNADARTRWNIYSCTKSLTGTAFGMLFEDSRAGRLAGGRTIDLDSRAYDYIPEGRPPSDERKADITIRHLLSMTSGIRGETTGIIGNTPAPGVGHFEMALGRGPAANGSSAAELIAAPGSKWDYSDPAFLHLSLIFSNLEGMELRDYMEKRLFSLIGLRDYEWDSFGGGGSLGPHTVSNSDMKTTARDLARFGYLQLAAGEWKGRSIVPPEWIALATRSSQELNRDYGLTWWTNSAGSLWPGVPSDAFAAMGFLANKCYVVPSGDLVVVRIGDGPWPWDDAPFLKLVVDSLV